MLRPFSVKLGIFALVLSPVVAHGQAADQSHTVRQGDTLWDLAKQYRGDPFLWPDIYRMNTAVVEDPHWIYPGEVLRLSGAEEMAAVPATDTPAPPAMVESEVAGAQVADTEPPIEQAGPATTATLAQLAQAPSGSDEQEPLFGPRPASTLQESIQAYTRKEYRPLRKTEFYSSGFLTENQKLPWARVIGPVTPSQIGATTVVNDAMPYVSIAIDAPRGATYQIGDTLLIAHRGADWKSYGEVIMPTGLATVTDTVRGRYIASVVAAYGPIRPGQSALPAEKFTPAGAEHAVPVSDGVRGELLGGPTRQDLKLPQMVVFIDKGQQDGVAAGDIFEVRRKAGITDDGRVRTHELLGTLQIVHVRNHSATGRLLNVLLPDIPQGTEVRQVAKLPS